MSLAVIPNVTVTAWETGEDYWRIVGRSKVHNLVTASGLDFARDMFAGVVPRPDTIKVGTGSTAVLATDTDLETPVFQKLISRRYPEEARITFQMLMDQTEGNGNTISEVGLFSGSTLVARAVLSPTISKTAAIFLTVAHEFTFTNGA